MSVPTSLIFVILIAAWLAVLVPMVARRREAVPETEVDGGTFRVLRRASASVRRRPKPGWRDEVEEDELVDQVDSNGLSDGEFPEDELADQEALDEELLDEDEDELDEFDEEPEPEPVPVGRRVNAVRANDIRETVAVVETETVETETYVEQYQTVGTERRVSAPAAHQSEPEESQLRPVPRRHGRGGYDPDAAEIARAYRYSRRRRVTVVLLVATIVFSLAAYFVKPILWSGTVVFGLLLIAYLGYLRRQVHIEADIRERRLARLARARQIRPEYPVDHADMPMAAAPFASAPFPSALSQVPPSGYRRGREVVDLEDDDPSFDDLDYYQPVTYRRASGQ